MLIAFVIVTACLAAAMIINAQLHDQIRDLNKRSEREERARQTLKRQARRREVDLCAQIARLKDPQEGN